MKDVNVLIIGGMGFIGSNLAAKTAKLGANVTLYDILLPNGGANPANIEDFREEVKVVEGDVRDEELLKKHLAEQHIVFNCAGHVSHINSMKKPLLDLELNCEANLLLLEALRRYNDQAKVVYTGTRSQVGKMVYSPFDENHPEFPRDIYSAHKSAAEKYHLIYHHAYGTWTTSLRISNTYGPRAPVRSPEFAVINYFIRLAVQDDVIKVYEPGTQTRDYIFVDDVVDAMILASQSEKANGEAFNVGSGGVTKLVDAARLITEVAGTGRVELIPWPKDRARMEVGDVIMNMKKIQDTLGWRAITELKDGLKNTVDFYRRNLSRYI